MEHPHQPQRFNTVTHGQSTSILFFPDISIRNRNATACLHAQTVHTESF
uniref:Uncharacterized protein n=1 Tax=Anguilla anguilla TaxID=7936 RepID=A0A0E9QKL9_ANGAN